MHIDLAYVVYRPEADQVKAACKNYFTPEKWVDISNQNYGITFITHDAPLIEIGDITTDANAVGWSGTIRPSSVIYSYVMNNYWGTNYKAEQSGKTTFRYTIQPHGMFLSAESEKMAAQESEPLVVVPLKSSKNESSSLFTILNQGIVVTALVPLNDGYLIRLFNAGGDPQKLNIVWKTNPAEVCFSDLDGKKTGNFNQGVMIPAWGLRTLKVRK
jgi:hypothetical protein